MDELMERLKAVARKKTKPFCYGCYKVAPSGRCTTCGSDDLMVVLEGVGVEWHLYRSRHNPYYAAI